LAARAKKTESAEDKAKLAAERKVAHWLNEIEAARKREKDFRKEGERILDIYGGKRKNETPFNILFSNTETIFPSVYSNTPRPVVQRRFKDDDPLGKMSSQAGQRGLEFLLDTNVDGYDTFDGAMKCAVLDALLPGRGVSAVKYDAEVVDVPDETKEGETPPEKPTTTPYKNWESICPDSVSWDRFLHGYARKWSKVPWIAYEVHLDEDEAEEAGIPDAVLALIQFTEGEDAEKEEGEKSKSEDEENIGERKTALFYQIWDKTGGRKVRYLCPQYKADFCLVQDDPLELTGFFNCPKPIQFLEKSNDLLPVAMYALYENQASELNKISTRIKVITASIKAKALYDTELGDDIKKLVDEDEPAMVPADKSASFAAEKGLQNAVWFWPVEKLIVVLRELYAAREQCKLVIYEIMGIADIMRGSSNASETLGAQKIKTQWGSLRLKRVQKEVQRYARDLLRMMLEVAAKKFDQRTWAQMTGLPFLLDEKFNELTALAKALQEKVQQEQMAAQAQAQAMPAVPGQPAPQPAPGPAAQQLQQVITQLQAPRWSTVLEMLRDDTQRAYRIDIETNSTVEPEATEDQKNIADIMNALSQLLNGLAPLVEKGIMPFEAAQAFMLAVVRRYRFGPEIEEYIKAMKPAKPDDDGKAAAEKMKADAEQKRMAFDMQAAQEDRAAAKQEMLLKAQLETARMNAEMARINREAQIAEREHAAKLEEIAAKAAFNKLMTDLKERQVRAKIAEADKPKEKTPA
jgi:hypothetical protein